MGNIQEKILLETADEFTYLTVKEILKDNDIPYIVKDDYSGGYMKVIAGRSIYNKKIIVSNMDYDKAYDLVGEFIDK